jgi:hypothetical protein
MIDIAMYNRAHDLDVIGVFVDPAVDYVSHDGAGSQAESCGRAHVVWLLGRFRWVEFARIVSRTEGILVDYAYISPW